MTALLCELVAVDSTNPDLVVGGAGEGAVAEVVANWLGERGCEVIVQLVEAERSNVIARVPGRGGGRSLLFNAHLDTVGVGDMHDAHRPRIENGRLYGRGAGDTKAGLVAAMWTMSVIARERPLRGDLILAAVIDEEAGSKGTEALVRDWHADAGIVLEPTGLAINIAHKGFVWATIRVDGVAAHGDHPDLGVDAIAKLGRVIVEIEQLDKRLRGAAPHYAVGSTGSIHCSLVHGGTELSSYPAQATLQVERRTVPGETAASIKQELTELLDDLAASDPALRASLTIDFSRNPLLLDASEPIATSLSRHVGALGQAAIVGGGSGWTDAALMNEAGIPSVIFGPRGEGSHGSNESVDLRSMEQCATTLVAVAREFCG
jgi:acetylornithine deacetylase/succinyl-diaminopimelate desuccinylase-like protein